MGNVVGNLVTYLQAKVYQFLTSFSISKGLMLSELFLLNAITGNISTVAAPNSFAMLPVIVQFSK